jgi:hypothetical protein
MDQDLDWIGWIINSIQSIYIPRLKFTIHRVIFLILYIIIFINLTFININFNSVVDLSKNLHILKFIC